MIRNILFASFMLLFSVNAWAQRSPEDVGMEIYEAIHAKDFERLHAMAPSFEVLQPLMNKSEEAGSLKADDVVKRMEMKMKAEFDDIIKSAKFEKVKLKKLEFDRIVEIIDNPEAPTPMKAVEMAMRYKGKPVHLSYSVVQAGDDWYYTGTLLSYSLFQQVRE